ncbi:MAG TPA: YraN family protein [Ktedonobacteraceae bacterium]|nr:YraN family protein [Ktedonobacteraceae bacterium]
MEKETNSGGERKNNARQLLGRKGEQMAAMVLLERGYRIIEHNFRCRYGEIDLIAEDRDDLVFVEVKTRKSIVYGLPEEAVTFAKRRKLVQVATYYLALHAYIDRSWRIDVVAIQLGNNGKFQEIRLYQHAVSEE